MASATRSSLEAARARPGIGELVRRSLFALRIPVVVVLLGAVYGPTLVEHARLAADPFRFADDVRILIPPLYRATDPELFPNDPIIDYYLGSLPDAHRLVFTSLAPLVGPDALSTILPYVLLAISLACLAFATYRLGGTVAVFGALALALGSAHVLGRMVGALPRAFALPMLLAGAACLVAGRPIALAACAVIAAAFYPVAGLLLSVCLVGLLFVLPEKDRGRAVGLGIGRKTVIVAVTGVAMVLVVLPAALRLRAHGVAIDASLVSAYPEAGPYGRFDPPDRPPFPALPGAALAPLTAALVGDGESLVPFANLRTAGKVVCSLIALVTAGGWIVMARSRVEARRLLVLPAAVVLAHTLALLVSPRLFLPERYMAYGVPAVALVCVPTAFAFFAEHARRALAALPLVWILVVLALVGARGVPWSGLTVFVAPAERPLHARIASLPSGALLAGFPGGAIDSVPYLARRSALVTRETHLPFHSRYTALLRERMRAFVAAYFASDLEPVRRLRERYGVTHLLVDRNHFLRAPSYFAPFGADIGRAFAAGKKRGFVLQRALAPNRAALPLPVVTATESLAVIDLSAL